MLGMDYGWDWLLRQHYAIGGVRNASLPVSSFALTQLKLKC
jgi:hypothetical protein